jgi:PAS domain S-box-containing protein
MDMRETVSSPKETFEHLIEGFEQAQRDVVERFDGLISEAHRLREQRNLFEEVIEHSCDGIFVVEVDTGTLRNVNEGTGKLVGRPAEELRGQPQISLFPEDVHEDLKTAFDQILKTGGISNLRTRMLAQDGQEVHVSISANTLPAPHEHLVVGFARDITKQVEVEEDLRALNETLEKRVEHRTEEIRLSNAELERASRQANRHAAEAEQANQAKSVFLANMTHEIRTPLNAVMGLLDLLMDMDLGDKEKETAEVISRSAGTLGTIINDILDFSKMEAGRLELEKVIFVLPDLVQKVLETFSFQARDLGLDLNLEMDSDLPEFVIGDPGRLRQVLVNLIGNALKFTDKGSVALEVTKVALSGHRYSVRFAVRDTGMGIAKKHQQDMFKAFTQADTSITRKFGGTGLGLNISSKLVRKMGGELEVTSAQGEGSTFFFTAHFGKASHQQIEDLKCHHRDSDSREALTKLGAQNLRILLVEDNKLNQRVAQGMLAKLGCKCETADNGLLALEALSKNTYGLVFMDLQMPEMDGLEAVGSLRRGKAGELNRNVPVIAMTAHASREDRKRCLAAGMNDYVPKPFTTELIGKAMLRVLDPCEDQEASGFSMTPLIHNTEGDVGMATEVLDQFMAGARNRLNLVIGALQNYDFDFATAEARHLESEARHIHSEAIVDLLGELITEAEALHQDAALDLATEIRQELTSMQSVI